MIRSTDGHKLNNKAKFMTDFALFVVHKQKFVSSSWWLVAGAKSRGLNGPRSHFNPLLSVLHKSHKNSCTVGRCSQLCSSFRLSFVLPVMFKGTAQDRVKNSYMVGSTAHHTALSGCLLQSLKFKGTAQESPKQLLPTV